jgi:hypothetical protein
MRTFFAIIGGFIIWAIAAYLLTEFVHLSWGMDSSALPVFLENWVASMVALLLAREAQRKIAPDDDRPHAYTLALAALLLCITLALAPLGSTLTWAILGALLACVVEWRTSGVTFKRR